MSFQVYEQGRPIDTPWQSLFPPRIVDPLTEIAPSAKISEYTPVDQFAQVQHQGDKERRPVYSAGQIMSFPVQTLPDSASIGDAWRFVEAQQFRHVVLVNQFADLSGIVSDRDLLKYSSSFFANAKSPNFPVANIMSTKVLSASPETNLRDLTVVMLERRVGSVPLLNEQHKLVGIVTRSDVLRTLSHQVPIELWT